MVCSTNKTSNSLLTFLVELTTRFNCMMQGVICTDPKGLVDKTFGRLCLMMRDDANENKNNPWIWAKTKLETTWRPTNLKQALYSLYSRTKESKDHREQCSFRYSVVSPDVFGNCAILIVLKCFMFKKLGLQLHDVHLESAEESPGSFVPYFC